MRPFVAFGALMAIVLALLLWQGSDAVVRVRSPIRPVRSTYPGGPIVELDGSPVYYPQERQVHRRAAQPHPQVPDLFGLMAESQSCPPPVTSTSTATTTRIVVRTTTATTTVTIAPTSSSSITDTLTATAV